MSRSSVRCCDNSRDERAAEPAPPTSWRPLVTLRRRSASAGNASELALEAPSPLRDDIANTLWLEDDRLAAVGENLREEPLLRLVRDVGDRRSVGESARTALELPA